MKKWITILVVLVQANICQSQTRIEKIASAVSDLEKDPRMAAATIALYVVDAGTGTVVYDHNSRVGLAPASTQKVITAVTAYEVLGQDFRYRTTIGYDGKLTNGVLNGALFVRGSGDPSFGSWRYSNTREQDVLGRMCEAVNAAHIKAYSGIGIDTTGWGSETVPDGWIWQDIANYYGAAATALNWRENQYEIVFHSGGAIGSPVDIVETKPRLYGFPLGSDVTAAEKGSGDNTYIYYNLNAPGGTVRGTIPVNEMHFTVSGAFASPATQFRNALADALATHGIVQNATRVAASTGPGHEVVLYTHSSPAFDSLVYWFLRKSINLYGEALVKTMALRNGGRASTEAGVQLVKEFWKKKGLDEAELHMVDGSGLSPLNRLTAHAQVTALAHARNQKWFPAFYEALPTYNGMKMKSGSISGARAFCGYHTSQDGHQYIFSMIINNYDGPANQTVQMMFKVLDELK